MVAGRRWAPGARVEDCLSKAGPRGGTPAHPLPSAARAAGRRVDLLVEPGLHDEARPRCAGWCQSAGRCRRERLDHFQARGEAPVQPFAQRRCAVERRGLRGMRWRERLAAAYLLLALMYYKHRLCAVRLGGAESVRQILQPIWHWLEHAPVHSQCGVDAVPACRQVRFCFAPCVV